MKSKLLAFVKDLLCFDSADRALTFDRPILNGLSTFRNLIRRLALVVIRFRSSDLRLIVDVSLAVYYGDRLLGQRATGFFGSASGRKASP